MVHVVTAANRHFYHDALEEMFAMRWHVAVHELGWTIPEVTPERDKDAYDLPETIYFLHYSDEGELIGTARLNPTTGPHLMQDVFPELCGFHGVPVGDDIYEYSRFLVKKTGVGRRENLRAQACISLAIIEYCLAAAIRSVTWVTYKRSYPLALRMYETRPLGLPQHFEADGEDYVAGISDMTAESLARTRRLAGIDHPVCQMTVPLQAVPDLTGPRSSRLHTYG